MDIGISRITRQTQQRPQFYPTSPHRIVGIALSQFISITWCLCTFFLATVDVSRPAHGLLYNRTPWPACRIVSHRRTTAILVYQNTDW